MECKSKTYEFIIVGGGPAGCTLASGLAKSTQRPRVLLLEAGGDNDTKSLRVDGQRWSTLLVEEMNWGYESTPQQQCHNRRINIARGKGLGGSTAINFGAWTIGARDDYDKWAAEVDDETFAWERVQERFKSLENFNGSIPTPQRSVYAAPKASDHGYNGPLRVGFAQEWEQDLSPVLDIFDKAGFERNLDINSGNPLGMSLVVNSSSQGLRTTAADMLTTAPDNLIVLTKKQVQRVVFDGNRAIGVESNGERYFAEKEVILCAGTLETPKILMHSGIGPADELEKFHIPTIHHLPAIGKGLRDHFLAPFIVKRRSETNDRNAFFRDQEAMNHAMKQWEMDGTGLWARHSCQLAAGWFKSDRISSSDEFKSLPVSVQDFLHRETVPHYEIISHFPIHFILPELIAEDYSYLCFAMFMMNQQSSGELRLHSSIPDDPLLIDPKFLDHAFDRRSCIEIFHHLCQVTNHPLFAKNTLSTLLAPASDSDDDVLEYWRKYGVAGLHSIGTVKMGKIGDIDAAVDNHFRVFGVKALRVADLSAVPVLTNNHTQATAYVTGAACAEVLLKDYDMV